MSDHQDRANAGQSLNLPVVFKFEEHTLRALHVDDKEVFVANDACAMLELANSRKAITSLDDDEKGVTTIQTPGGAQEVNVITESGLYNLIVSQSVV
jgi:prophage antirepressor-like protein